MADTSTAITVTIIIFSEFPDKADYYYGFIHLAWAGGFLIGPVIALLLYDSVGYAGLYYLIAGVIVLGALIPATCMIPARLNAI